MQPTEPHQTQTVSHDNQPHNQHDNQDDTRNATKYPTEEPSNIFQATPSARSLGTIIPTIPAPSQRHILIINKNAIFLFGSEGAGFFSENLFPPFCTHHTCHLYVRARRVPPALLPKKECAAFAAGFSVFHVCPTFQGSYPLKGQKPAEYEPLKSQLQQGKRTSLEPVHPPDAECIY